MSHVRMSHATYSHICMSHLRMSHVTFGVATISRLLKIIGLFCRISYLFQGSFAKETYKRDTRSSDVTRVTLVA